MKDSHTEFLGKNWFKLVLIALLALCIVLIFLYFQESNRLTEEKIIHQQELDQKELEAKDKEFAAKQKESCLAIYKQESSKWNNVSGWSYNEDKQECHIEYREQVKKTKSECDANYKGVDGKVPQVLFMDYLLCLDGLFEKTF